VGVSQDSNLPDYIIQVKDTKPLWFYCSQTNHCARGMVFSVNADPNGNATFADYQKLALASGITNPHIPPVRGGEISTFDVPESGSDSYDHKRLSGAATENAKSGSSSSKGAVIGASVGTASLVLLSVLGFCYYRRRRGSSVVSGVEGGGNPRFMAYAASSYRPMDTPAPGAAVEKHPDYEPLVTPDEKASAHENFYSYSGAYDPPQRPVEGQHSTAWDQRR
jgi:hypothetical protein